LVKALSSNNGVGLGVAIGNEKNSQLLLAEVVQVKLKWASTIGQEKKT